MNGLRMLYEILTAHDPNDQDAVRVQNMIDGIEHYFKTYALHQDSEDTYFYQGGTVDTLGIFTPTTNPDGTYQYAVDCQTWPMGVLGPELIDSWFPDLDVPLKMWQTLERKGGAWAYDNKTRCTAGDSEADSECKLRGVGYTDVSQILPDQWVLSGEWTWGAVVMARKLAKFYNDDSKFPLTMGDQLKEGIDTYVEKADGVYAYANERVYIPFGWYASTLRSVASTGWAVFRAFECDVWTLGCDPDNVGGAGGFTG